MHCTDAILQSILDELRAIHNTLRGHAAPEAEQPRDYPNCGDDADLGALCKSPHCPLGRGR